MNKEPTSYMIIKLVIGAVLFLAMLAFHGYVATLSEWLLALPFVLMGVKLEEVFKLFGGGKK